MAKSPIVIELGRAVEGAENETLARIAEMIDDAYRLLRGDIKEIEKRLDDGGL